MNRAFVIAVLAAFPFTARAALAATSCPATVAIEERAVQPPDGWSARASAQHPALVGVTIFEGPPEQNASLVYDDQKETPQEIIQTWKLAHGVTGYWLTCRYSHTGVELTRKLPDSAAQCRVMFERDKSAPDGLGIVQSASCE